MFSDESSIWKNLSGSKRWINKSDKNDIDRSTKYPLKKHIWGLITKKGINKIHIFSNIMDSHAYLDILKNNLLPIHKKYPKLIF
jgi:hypothetical protein